VLASSDFTNFEEEHMRRILRHRPSPAMVIACVALTVALGGTSYAAVSLPRNSVGTKQLKRNAVTSIKIKNNSVTGADVLESSLGRVRSATSAVNATNATTATTAASATNATNATNATKAATADNASRLGGVDPSGFLKNGAAASGALSGNYPNPSLADGSVTTSKIAAAAVGISKLGTIPAVRAFNSALVAAADGAVVTVPFNSESFDTAGLHSTTTNTGRLVAPVAGVYQVTGGVRWSANASGTRFLAIGKNGGSWQASDWRPAAGALFNITDQSVSTLVALDAGDWVQLDAYQDSGSALTIGSGTLGPYLAMHWVGSATAGSIASVTTQDGTGPIPPAK
jgi:hypothetical protein